MIYSISHNDLDGYSSQLLVKMYADQTNQKITMFNVNYGKELLFAIESLDLTKNDFVFITDLNLEENVALLLDKLKEQIGFKLQVIDHHETGKNIASKYSWYFYNKEHSATKLTYDFFTQYFKEPEFVYLVNLYDMWIEENKDFEKAKSLNTAFKDILKHYTKNIMELRRDFAFELIFSFSKILLKEKNIFKAEKKISKLERRFLSGDKFKSISTLRAEKAYEYIYENEMYKLVSFGGYKIKVLIDLNEVFQEVSHIILNKEKDIDFVIHINKQGFMSFRSSENRPSVELFAKQYFDGGGHRNASGGALNGARNGKKFKKEDLFELFLNQLNII